MVFSNSSTKMGLIEDVDFLTGATNASYSLANKTRNINSAYQGVVGLIWKTVVGWQYDDSNKTDLPILTTTLVHNQQDYSMPSTAQRLHRVEVKDSNGDFHKLTQIDWHDIRTLGMTEYLETPGLPIYYDAVGNSIFLYPKPSSADVTLAAGLKLFVDRDVALFTTASTTAAPGFATQFHRILSYSAAIDYEKDPQQLQKFLIAKSALEKGLQEFYASRNPERPSRIKPQQKRNWKTYL